MQRLRERELAQRVVLSVGLGLVFAVVGIYVGSDGFAGVGRGWSAYAPMADTCFTASRPPGSEP